MHLVTAVDTALLIIVQVLTWVSAGLPPRTVRFGVRVPPEHADGPAVLRARRIFRVGIVAVTSITLPTVVFAAATGMPYLMPLVFLFALAGDFAVFSAARRMVSRAKTSEQWYAGPRRLTTVDVAARPQIGGLRWSWWAPVAVIALTVIIGAWRYPHLPPRLVLHFDSAGIPDWTVPTSLVAAFAPVFGQVFLTAILIASAVAARRMPVEASPADGGVRSERLAAALLTLGVCTNLSLGLVAIQQWWGGTQLRWPLVAGALAATVLGMALLAAVTLRGQASEPAPNDGADDDRHWRGGLFYHNPDDPKLLVPKRFGIGLTFNFGHRLAWVYLTVLFALPIASWALAALANR